MHDYLKHNIPFLGVTLFTRAKDIKIFRAKGSEGFKVCYFVFFLCHAHFICCHKFCIYICDRAGHEYVGHLWDKALLNYP